jgi:hypothetical protein
MMVSICFYRYIAGGEWHADPGRGTLPAGESTGESGRCPLQLKRERVVGCGAIGRRSHLFSNSHLGANLVP